MAARRKIWPSEALAQASYDAYRSAYETAKANLAVGQASILQARAGLAQAQAVLNRAKRNLGYCTIISPVKGVIIDRRVNIMVTHDPHVARYAQRAIHIHDGLIVQRASGRGGLSAEQAP